MNINSYFQYFCFLSSHSGLIFNLCRKVFPNIILFLFILKICLPFTLLDGSITFGFKLAEVRPILINYIRQIAAYCIQITIFISMLCNTIDWIEFVNIYLNWIWSHITFFFLINDENTSTKTCKDNAYRSRLKVKYVASHDTSHQIEEGHVNFKIFKRLVTTFSLRKILEQ